ncbi:hypothetical protein [Parvicella tangerina]|uniref:Uncharacterized protein n=1 Tax=Parvicella tangerina TaxID=2829795 RepID=A0A916JMX9_9FLAO|nr:hypothetical protein [Parvicella tangerina]CAG5081873.1 hypothetical protein CRYO30217_01750 [Parvicella tangerina]
MSTTEKHSVSILLFLIGVLPVSTVAMHALGWIHVQVLLFPNVFLIAVALVYLSIFSSFGNKLVKSWMMGIGAVLLYDLSRIPFICCGWTDFIPGLGGWIVGEKEHFYAGYLWRYLGNGAGLGMAFCVLRNYIQPKRIIAFGALYGVCIFACLDIILLSSSYAQSMMFEVTPISFIGGLTGHIVYGTTLGLLTYLVDNKISDAKAVVVNQL